MKNKSKLIIAAVAIFAVIVVILLIVRPGHQKAEDPTAPLQTGEETGSEQVEPQTEDDWDNAGSRIVGQGCYDNTRQLEWQVNKRTVVTFGLGKKGEMSDAIYLNPSCSAAGPNNRIGYYVESSRCYPRYGYEKGLGDCDSAENKGHLNYLINDILYTDVMPADGTAYQWADDFFFDGKTGGTTLTIRAVSLDTGEFLGICRLDIEYDGSTYFMSKVTPVKQECGLPEEKLNKLLSDAVAFADFRMVDMDEDDTEWMKIAKDNAVVEKRSNPYFRILSTASFSFTYARDWFDCKDTYAVTLPISYYGYATIYFAPANQCADDNPSDDLIIYGFDPVMPYNEQTIIAPQGYLEGMNNIL